MSPRALVLLLSFVVGCGGQIDAVPAPIVDATSLDALGSDPPPSDASLAFDSALDFSVDGGAHADSAPFVEDAPPSFDGACSASAPAVDCSEVGVEEAVRGLFAVSACGELTVCTGYDVSFDGSGCVDALTIRSLEPTPATHAADAQACVEAWLRHHRFPCAATTTLHTVDDCFLH